MTSDTCSGSPGYLTPLPTPAAWPGDGRPRLRTSARHTAWPRKQGTDVTRRRHCGCAGRCCWRWAMAPVPRPATARRLRSRDGRGQALGTAHRHEPRPAVARPRQTRLGARTAGAGLWPVHRGLRHAGPTGSQGGARRAWLRPRSYRRSPERPATAGRPGTVSIPAIGPGLRGCNPIARSIKSSPPRKRGPRASD